MTRPLLSPRRAPSEPSRPLGVAVREALRAPRRVWAFNAVLAAACALVWAIAVGGLDRPAFGRSPVLAWYWLALAFYLAEVLVVHLQFRKQAHTISLTEIGLTLGLLLGAPSSLLVGQLVGTLVALVVNRRRSQLRQLAKFAFNLAELPLCSGIALVVFRSLASPADSSPHLWGLVLVACGVGHVVGILLVSTVIAIAEERFQAPQLGRTLVTSTLGALATASLGLAVVELLEVRPLAVLLLVFPVLACVGAFRGYMEQREQREHVEFLYESMRATQGAPEFGLAVGQLLVAARRLLRAEYAEILLLPPSDGEGPLRSISGAEGELLMHPEERFSSEDAAAFTEVESVGSALLLTQRRATHAFEGFLRSRGLEEAIVAPLRGEDRTFGLLVVGERLGDVSTFTEADVELLGTFSGHSSILLENGRLEHSLAQLTQLKEQLRHQAYHDGLTGLPNRLHLLEAVEHELAHGTGTTAVLYLDLDRFKTVNDTWGHSAGDELLTAFAARLAGATRAQDLAARIGGDEFAVLVRDVDATGAVSAARRMLEAIDGTYTLGCGDVACHVSVGIAVGAAGITSGEDLIRNADIAMYSVKRSERAYTLYEADLHEKLRAQRQLGLDLEAALERREILVHFQPVVRLADGQIDGFEVLARWPHPTRGLLSAGDFLPVAEETGLTVELGRLVLQQALEAARRWPQRLTIWLNVAAAELANERLVDTLAEALKGYGVDPSRLVIEVTESGVIQGSDGAIVAMRRLRELGVGLTIDDFGTGYSSLSRLAEFPIESLKIPKPFVDKLVGEDADEAFVDAILRLADSLGLGAVAEGIEHPAQAERLRELGCSLGQGYLFGRPMPADEVERVLYRETPRTPQLRLVPAPGLAHSG
ncbi:MAG TPA: EAL domain-containing protein [Gaiellaceae bacterium]|nr:EAL domain-containing protein [Gaiellaceae bacterium]